jgi:hypothetical protein
MGRRGLRGGVRHRHSKYLALLTDDLQLLIDLHLDNTKGKLGLPLDHRRLLEVVHPLLLLLLDHRLHPLPIGGRCLPQATIDRSSPRDRVIGKGPRAQALRLGVGGLDHRALLRIGGGRDRRVLLVIVHHLNVINSRGGGL